MPDSSPKMLPGKVVAQYVRCGRANCRCASGKLHTAHYRYWWADGQRRKAYVRRADVAEVMAACARWHEADSVMASSLNSPAADEVRAQVRGMLRAALGDNPGVERALRRWRGRGHGRDDGKLEDIAGRFASFELPMFKF
ncbi:MAG: DUF6788 family protein [Pyrinomonadaceae bacterium]